MIQLETILKLLVGKKDGAKDMAFVSEMSQTNWRLSFTVTISPHLS
jgi:hypothetical protein